MPKRVYCQELVARTPVAILERSDRPQDWTHLQRCGAPATEGDRCARHAKQPNNGLREKWRRFARQARI